MRADYLTPEEVAFIERLLTPGNALVVRVLLHTGLRVGDVLALRREQLRRQFWITEQKTGRRRRVNLPDDLIADVLAGGDPGNPWAFPGRKPGEPRTRQAVWWDIKRAARALRLPANAAPHSLRKSYAVERLHSTGDLEAVRRALNHDDAVTTLVYALADAARNGRKTRRRRRAKSSADPRQT